MPGFSFRFSAIYLIFFTQICFCKQQSDLVPNENTTGNSDVPNAFESPWPASKREILSALASGDKAGLLNYFGDEVQIAHVMSLEILLKSSDATRFRTGETIMSKILFDDAAVKKILGPHLFSFKTAFTKGRRFPDNQQGESFSAIAVYRGYAYSINAICNIKTCQIRQFVIHSANPEKANARDQGPD